jgi:serine protease Do
VGDWVIAIGNPFGLGGTVTAGIISARARNLNEGPFDDFIQTDAAINRGNSGGPMFNMNGEVIGINTAIFSPSGGSVGIGFAVPSQLAKTVFKELRERGHIDRGWLGVKIQPVTDEIAESLKLNKAYGALVAEVSPGSPAAKAGVKSGDVVTHFDGKEVKEMHNLPRMVAETPIGKTVEVELWRNGESKTVSITVGEMKETEEADDEDEGKENAAPAKVKGKEVLGMMLSTLTNEEREKSQLPADVKGVIVRSVKEDSEAAKNDIEPGDVIVQVGSGAVTTPAEVSAAVANVRKQGRKYVLLRITRGKDMSMFVTVPVENVKKPEE